MIVVYMLKYMIQQTILAIEGGIITGKGKNRVYRQYFGQAMLDALKKAYEDEYGNMEDE